MIGPPETQKPTDIVRPNRKKFGTEESFRATAQIRCRKSVLRPEFRSEFHSFQSKTEEGTRMMKRVAIALLLAGVLGSQIYFGQDKKTSSKKNSDVDNVGNRDINKGNINFTSLEKEQQIGRELAAEVERQV